MHPLNRFSPPRGVGRVFHVTNSGLSSSTLSFSAPLSLFPSDESTLLPLLFLLVAELASLTALGVELVVLCTLDELVVDGEGASSRDTAAGR